MLRKNQNHAFSSQVAVASVADKPEARSIGRKTILLMGLVSGITVANLFYNQPLLAQMGKTFGVGHAAGYIPTYTFIGLALGMVLFVPLGDLHERRRLIAVFSLLAAAAAAGVAAAPDFIWLAVAAATLGLFSIIQHLILPFAAQAVPEGVQGKAVATVYMGVLLGVLLGRTIGGFVGGSLGWRMMYWIAAALMLIVAAIVLATFPKWQPREALRYQELLRSLWTIFIDVPELRRVSLVGGTLFSALSAFWVNCIFLVSTPPYHYGERAVGLLALVIAVGAIAAPLVGHMSDRWGARFGLGIGLVSAFLGFADLWAFKNNLALLIVGVILLDAGVRIGQVSNQTHIYGLVPDAPSRANTIYMTCYFCGGALGAAAGAFGWDLMGWDGVCIVGISLLILALGGYLRNARKAQPRHTSQTVLDHQEIIPEQMFLRPDPASEETTDDREIAASCLTKREA